MMKIMEKLFYCEINKTHMGNGFCSKQDWLVFNWQPLEGKLTFDQINYFPCKEESNLGSLLRSFELIFSRCVLYIQKSAFI